MRRARRFPGLPAPASVTVAETVEVPATDRDRDSPRGGVTSGPNHRLAMKA